MRYRTAVILPYEDLGQSGTKVIDINVKDPITALRFNFRHTAVTGARIAPMEAMFSKIELVDGSDVLMSLSGTQLSALHFYEGNRFIHVNSTNFLNGSSSGFMQYNFGRFFRDPVLAFDPTRFRNPQLRITYDARLPQALGSNVLLEIVAELFDEKVISPVGFLRSTEFHSYTPGTSTYQYIDLPTDLVIRKLFLQTKGWGYSSGGLLTDVKLSEDNDRKVPFEMIQRNWMNLCSLNFGSLQQIFWATMGGMTEPIFYAACEYEAPVIQNTTAHAACRIIQLTGGKATFSAATGTQIGMGIVHGILPYYVYCYPFGDEKDIDDWYDVTKIGSLRFRVKSGANGASATFHTILQQFRRY